MLRNNIQQFCINLKLKKKDRKRKKEKNTESHEKNKFLIQCMRNHSYVNKTKPNQTIYEEKDKKNINITSKKK